MIFCLLLIFSVFSLTASGYRSSVLVPTYKALAEWKNDFKVNLFVSNEDPLLINNRLSLYSPGLVLPTATGNDEMEGYTSIVDNFLKIKHSSKGFLEGDHVTFEPPYSGVNNPNPLKLISFGQGDDAFRMIQVLDTLQKFGLAEIDIDGACLGILRTFHALFALGHSEEYPGAQKFFTAASIDRIDREKILNMIRIMAFNAPLKKPTDIVRAICIEPCASSLRSFFIKGLLSNLGISSQSMNQTVNDLIASAGSSLDLGSETIKDSVALALFKLMAQCTSYDASYPSIDTMMLAMKHYQCDYPLLSGLFFVKKGDQVVGDWGNQEFFESLPINDHRKAIIPSSMTGGHLDLDVLQLAALFAWKKKFGGSYYDVSSTLQLGDQVLDLAQTMNGKNKLYFSFYKKLMENKELYDFAKQAVQQQKENVFFDKEIEQCIDGSIRQFNKFQKACL